MMLQIVVEVAGTVCDADCVSIACRDDQIKCEGNAALWLGNNKTYIILSKFCAQA